ncbi:transcription factor S-II, central domain-containing protein [Thamnidium elegans]|nr:transcription factor S-II, central domain-containing protein [Thamnidium elegans]
MRTASMSEAPKTRRASTSKKSSPEKTVQKDEDEKVKEEDLKEEEKVDLKDEEYNVVEKKEDEDEEEEEEDEEEETVTREGTETPDTPMSPSQMTEQENPVRRNVIKNMSSILKIIIDSALQENPDLFDSEQEKPSSEERAEKLARSIENTMLEQLGDMGKSQHRRTCGEPYKSKFRSLLYNLKDKQNKVFQVRVITGDLSPLELVKMSSEDMANPELKSMSEVLRKTALKNSVMKLDNTPIIKKTHKGDIIMVPNKDNDTNQNMYSEQVESIHTDHTTIPTPSPPASFSPKVDERTITSFSPNSTGSKLDPLDDILARIGIPAHDDNNKRNSSDASAADQSKKRKVTLDVAELLGEEEETPFQVEEVDTSELLAQEQENNNNDQEEKDVEMEEMQEPEEEKLPFIWQGRVNMPQVAEFEASARQIGGRTLSEAEWAEVLSPTMWIEGRIPAERVTSYVTQSQYSNSREIVLLEIEPDTTDQLKPKEIQLTNATQSQTLLKYLDSRQRYAVVGHNKTKVKDFYLIPLYKVQHIPDCLYVVRVEETKRECDLFLGVLVLTKQQPVTKPIITPVVTKPVYSTPMAQPMYLSTQTYSNYQPQPTQPPPQEYSYGYQQPSYGRQSSNGNHSNNNNNNGNQRNHYSYNQRNQNNSSRYRPSY